MWMFMFPYLDEFVRELFVDICLDFSIAQYMEDFSLFNIQKKILLFQIRKKKHFTDILECSINKKTIIKTIVKKAHKSLLTNGTGKK